MFVMQRGFEMELWGVVSRVGVLFSSFALMPIVKPTVSSKISKNSISLISTWKEWNWCTCDRMGRGLRQGLWRTLGGKENNWTHCQSNSPHSSFHSGCTESKYTDLSKPWPLSSASKFLKLDFSHQPFEQTQKHSQFKVLARELGPKGDRMSRVDSV